VGRFSKYLGRMTITIDQIPIELNKMTVEDVQKLMDASEDKENALVSGHKALMDIMRKCCPEEDEKELESFVLQKQPELTEKILVGLGWVQQEQIDKYKQEALEKKK